MRHQEAELLLAAGAALDDLAPDERDAYDAHRRGCEACAVLADELSFVLADLSLLVPERVPPPDLLAGIRLAIDAEDAAGSGLAPRRDVTPPRTSWAPSATGPVGSASAVAAPSASAVPPAPAITPTPAAVVDLALARAARRPLVAAVGLAAALAIVAVGLGARTSGLQDELGRAEAQVALLREELGNQGAVMAASINPAHVTVALHAEPLAPAANAVVVYVPGTDGAWIVAENLPATPAGHGYQLWYADAAGVHGLDTVSYDGSGTFVAPLGVDLARSTAVMLTLEPAGGATGDPGEQVVFGEL